MAPFSLPEFVSHWQKSTLTERSASQTHFNGLCEILGEPKPAESDPDGSTYTFEKGAAKSEGGQGWADVWKRGYFGWEYKGKRKKLEEAYKQLLQYREDLENPPLLVTCDLDRFEVHTNFTNTAPQIYKFNLADLLKNETTSDCPIPPLDVLRLVFTDPAKLKPGLTTEQVTEKAAAQFSQLAKSLRDRGVDPEKGAHFLMRLLFCLFSEDIGLLPGKLFTRLVNSNLHKPVDFDKKLKQLFAAMSGPNGSFGADDIAYFNGGLFSDDQTYELSSADLEILSKAAVLDWGHVEPAIFGTLFERSLDPSKRSQLGAHYTSRDDINLIVEPVVMAPLRRRWVEVKTEAQALASKIAASSGAARTKYKQKLRDLLMGFAEHVSTRKVLDPACGSGNFLYVALKALLDLEKQISTFAATNGLSGLLPKTDPSQLFGIEINVYAHELASVVVWIGYIQWQHDNGFNFGSSPILKPLTNIRRMDAVLAYDKDGKPIEPGWPEADVIIGNPPFLGDKKMREGLGDKYVDDLRNLYADRVPGGADFVTYWFENARRQIESKKAKRAGLLATNSIAMIANRKVIERIKSTGDVFMAWSDREWILEGASVRVSMLGFDDGSEQIRILDGTSVIAINADLTSGIDVTTAASLSENDGLCFLGMMKGGPFDILQQQAQEMLAAPVNPNGRSNSDVVKRRLGGSDVVQRSKDSWIIDFNDLSLSDAALYEKPFEYVRAIIKPIRDASRDKSMKTYWWLHGRSRPALRAAISGKTRCIVTPEVSKHRIFVWMNTDTIPDHKLHVFALSDDYSFGVLQSKVHELWSLAQCSWLGVGNDPSYSSSRTFETFAFPWPPGKEPKDNSKVKAIAAAAKELVEKRNLWLNPIGGSPDELKKRTLTNLYNQRPQWLENLHQTLDAAVFAAYGWPDTLTDAEILEKLLALNLQRTAKAKTAGAK